MKAFWVVLICGLSLGVFAQDGSLSTHKAKMVPMVDSNAPVTEAEAKATFKKVDDNLASIVGKPVSAPAIELGDSTKPVTREAVITEFGHIFNAMSPSFKFTPRSVWYDPKVITIQSPALRKTLDKLIKQGFVSRVCPLVT